MSSHAESPSSLWSVEARQLASDALEMLELRRELAELEIRHGTRVGKRLAIAGGAGAVLIITSLPLLLTSLAHGLSTWTRLSPANWILILGGFSLLLGAGDRLGCLSTFSQRLHRPQIHSGRAERGHGLATRMD